MKAACAYCGVFLGDTPAAHLTADKNEVNLNNTSGRSGGRKVSNTEVAATLEAMQPGTVVGTSRWVTVDQAMIDRFGAATLDPDPMHIDPQWAHEHGPFGGTI